MGTNAEHGFESAAVGYLVGTDEAGYAPNLGPLVISATVWHVPGDPWQADLYDLLRDAVAPSPAKRLARPSRPRSSGPRGKAVPPAERLVLADSKLLYSPASGLAALETGLLALLGLMGQRPPTWRQIWSLLDPESAVALACQPWHHEYDLDLPLEADTNELRRHELALRNCTHSAGVRLLAVRSRAVFPDCWNRLTEQQGNKATALSQLTLELLCELLAPLGNEPVLVICDKHGGRNRYRSLLQQFAAEQLVEVYAEGRDESIYRWGPSDRRTEVRFCVKAERYLPTASASMASKYLRELAMRAFNHYWCRHVPALRPTAGYPLDAVRFKAEIAEAQIALGIADAILWRNR